MSAISRGQNHSLYFYKLITVLAYIFFVLANKRLFLIRQERSCTKIVATTLLRISFQGNYSNYLDLDKLVNCFYQKE